MLSIISDQTKWYLNKAEQLRKVTLQLENLHPDAIRIKQRRINKALYMAKFIVDLTRSAQIAFGGGSISEQQQQQYSKINKYIDNAQNLVNVYFKNKAK